jgi:hypothetical protein
MRNRAQEFLIGSRGRTFLSISIFTFLTKLTLGWRSGIERGWQDELEWANLAQNSSFISTTTTYDSGYPTPLLRILSIVLSGLSQGSFLLWHSVTLLFIAFSVASLAYIKLLGTSSILVLASLVSAYPSFDLLLLHNLSYWTSIPLFVLLTNLFSADSFLNFRMIFLMVILVILTAKPQLLISMLVLSVCMITYRKELRIRLLSLPCIILVLFIAGRFSSQPIALSIDYSSFLIFILTFFSHFFIVSAPLLTLVFFAATKFTTLDLTTLFYPLSTFLVVLLARKRMKTIEYLKSFQSVFLALVPYVLSLYFFSNSGWSQDNLLTSAIYTSLFSRHYLPIVLIAGFLTLLISKEGRFSRRVLILAAFQSVIMQVVLFENLYASI